MTKEQLVIEYIQKGYSNRYIKTLLDIGINEIETYRELLKNEKEKFIKGVVNYGNE